jgi:hypothetical protein
MIQQKEVKLQEDLRTKEKEKASTVAPLEESFSYVRGPAGVNDLAKLADLNAERVEQSLLNFIPFLPTDNEFHSPGSPEEKKQIEVYTFLNDDLLKLLKMPFSLFWCYAFYDKSVSTFLDSFLRYFRLTKLEIEEMHAEYSGKKSSSNSSSALASSNSKPLATSREPRRILWERCFRVLLRLGNPRESDQHFMRDVYYRDHVIRRLRLFDVPKLMDIVRLYAEFQQERVTEMVQRLMGSAIELRHSFESSLGAISNVLEELANQICVTYYSRKQYLTSTGAGSLNAPVSGGKNVQQTQSDQDRMMHNMEEVQRYLADIALTMATFVTMAGERGGCASAIRLQHSRLMSQWAIVADQQKQKQTNASNANRHSRDLVSLLALCVYYYEVVVPWLDGLFSPAFQPSSLRASRPFCAEMLDDVRTGLLGTIFATLEIDLLAPIFSRSGRDDSSEESERKVETFLDIIAQLRSIGPEVQTYRLDTSPLPAPSSSSTPSASSASGLLPSVLSQGALMVAEQNAGKCLKELEARYGLRRIIRRLRAIFSYM